jgi:hypothetical protein
VAQQPVLEEGSQPAYISLARHIYAEWDDWGCLGNCWGRSEKERGAWTKDKGDEGFDYHQEQMALRSCEMCPVQWDCVTFALREEQMGSIFALKWWDRKKLRKEPDALALIEQARLEGRAVRSVLRVVARRELIRAAVEESCTL